MNKRPIAVLLPVIAVFAFLFGWQVGQLQIKPTSESLPSVIGQTRIEKKQADLSLFWDVWGILQGKYVDRDALNTEQMVYGAIRGMVAALDDPYTVFMDPAESKEFSDSLTGKLEGIGAELTVKDKNLTVMSVLRNSPAEKNGLTSGDIILKINDEGASDMTVYEAITKIRGKKGTSVKLLIFRKSGVDPFDVTIVRDSIRLDSVKLEDKGKGLFYLGLNQFTDVTPVEMSDAISKILFSNPRGVILDLRDNGGGYLEVAIEILSELISGKREVVTIRKRDLKDDEIKFSSGSGRLASIPLVILINGASASASEIVAGAVQDLKRGTLVGEKSYGKGSVQEIEDNLKEGASLRITIAKWLTPLKRSIDKVGIEPDIKVPLTENDLKKNKDPQLEAALQILKK